jgi:nitrile hydratase
MSEDHAERIGAIHRELHSHLPSEPALRVKALESLLVEKGLLDPRTVDAWIEVYTEEIGPKRGAEVVARAWTDPGFRDRLLHDGTAAITEIGYEGWASGHLKIVENTRAVHNLVVCTLCSCYPRAILGLPPDWYKSRAYRSRAVREPREVMAEFGLAVPGDVTVRVHDSTADMRYLVLPKRPKGTEGWSEEKLAEIVTRDTMIGVAEVRIP